MKDSTEIPDGEITVSCTNLLKTLNFLRKNANTPLEFLKVILFATLTVLRATILLFFNQKLCSENSIGIKINFVSRSWRSERSSNNKINAQ